MPLPYGRRVARFLSRAIFLALLAVMALTAIPYGTVEPWWEALFQSVIFALGALWVIEGALGQGWFGAGHRIFVPLLLIVLYAFIQTIPLQPTGAGNSGLRSWSAISADPYHTRLAVLKLLALILTGAMLLRYTSNERRLRALVYTIIGIALVSAFFGILRQTTQTAPGFFLTFLSPGSGYGQFINRNHFAFLMEMALGLILGLILYGGVPRRYILVYLALALPVWTALVLSNSRGGLLSMFALMLFLALLFNMRPRQNGDPERRVMKSRRWNRIAQSLFLRTALIAGLLAAILVGAIWVGGESLTSRLESVSGEMSAQDDQDNRGSQRQEIWSATWRMIKDHPLTGVGFNGYWAVIPAYHKATGEITPQQAHNDYLEIMASGGIIGVALSACFIFLLLKGARQNFRSQDSFHRAATLGAYAGLFGVAIHSAVDFGLHITINAVIFTALIVITMSGYRVKAKGQEPGEIEGAGLTESPEREKIRSSPTISAKKS